MGVRCPTGELTEPCPSLASGRIPNTCVLVESGLQGARSSLPWKDWNVEHAARESWSVGLVRHVWCLVSSNPPPHPQQHSDLWLDCDSTFTALTNLGTHRDSDKQPESHGLTAQTGMWNKGHESNRRRCGMASCCKVERLCGGGRAWHFLTKDGHTADLNPPTPVEPPQSDSVRGQNLHSTNRVKSPFTQKPQASCRRPQTGGDLPQSKHWLGRDSGPRVVTSHTGGPAAAAQGGFFTF
ncbi:hypothetical protein AGIG_G12733 [Arapaima gigas]